MSSLKLGGDYSRPTQTQSAKICPNLHWGGGGKRGGVPDQLNPKCHYLSSHLHWGRRGGVPDQLNPKCHNLSNICIWGVGVVQTNSTQSVKICPNLHWREGWCSRPTQPKVPRSVQICIFGGGGGEGGSGVQTHPTQSAKICPNLHWGGGGRGWWFRPTFLKYLSGGTQRILNQKFWKPSLLLHHRESLTYYVWRLTRQTLSQKSILRPIIERFFFVRCLSSVHYYHHPFCPDRKNTL